MSEIHMTLLWQPLRRAALHICGIYNMYTTPLLKSGRAMPFSVRMRDSTGSTIRDSPGSSTCTKRDMAHWYVLGASH